MPVGIGTPDAIAKAVIIKLGARTHALDTDQRSLALPLSPRRPAASSSRCPSNPNAAPARLLHALPAERRGRAVGGQDDPARHRAAGALAGARPAAPAPRGAAKFPAPKLKKLTAKFSFTRKVATVKLTMRVSKAFAGTVKLFPIVKGKSAKAKRAAKKAIASKSIKGRGGRNVAVVVRFKTKGMRFPLKLRMTIGLRDPRGGPTRTITKGLLLQKRPKPVAKILAKAK